MTTASKAVFLAEMRARQRVQAMDRALERLALGMIRTNPDSAGALADLKAQVARGARDPEEAAEAIIDALRRAPVPNPGNLA